MNFGLRTKLAGAVVFDSRAFGAGYVETIAVSAGAPSGSRNYPHLKGYTLRVVILPTNATAFGKPSVTTSVGTDGTPSLSWSRRSAPSGYTNNTSALLVFAK